MHNASSGRRQGGKKDAVSLNWKKGIKKEEKEKEMGLYRFYIRFIIFFIYFIFFSFRFRIGDVLGGMYTSLFVFIL